MIPFHQRYWYATFALVVVYCCVFIVFTIGRLERYNATGFDFAFYHNVLWRTVHTDVMGLSIEANTTSNWAVHVEPILLVMAPVYALLNDKRWLLVWQTLALAGAALAVHRIATRRWGSPKIGTLFASLYLLYPTIGWINKFDFHPLAFATPLLLFAWDAAEVGRWWRCSVLLLLAMMCKEEVGFVVAAFGLWWYVHSGRHWMSGLAWAAVGIAYSLLSLLIIMPAAQGSGISYHVGMRYAWLFEGNWYDRWAYLTGPDTGHKIRWLAQVFAPLLFLSLRRPGIVAISSPVFGLSLLSTRSNQWSIYHHYLADAIPFIIVAAIYGSHDLARWLQRWVHPLRARRLLFTGMVTATVMLFIVNNPFTTIPREPYGPIYGWEPGASLDGLRTAETVIPPDACVTASNNIAAAYGQRKYIYVFGIGNWEQCDLSIVDFADYRFQSFGVPQQLACRQFRELGFRPIFVQDNVVIVKRNADSTQALIDQVALLCRDN